MNLYCIDTSSLINLRFYPREVLATLWDLLEDLAGSSRLISPREVFREVSRQEDQAHRWARDHLAIFIDPDDTQAALVRALQAQYPSLNQPDRPYHADPWCVAVTKLNDDADRTCVLITDESDLPTRLPGICRAESLRCGRLIDLPGFEGLKFMLTRV